MKTMRKLSGMGDEIVAEYEAVLTTPERLKEIEDEFNKKLAQGFFAANLETQELIRKFDPEVDILLIPRVQGGQS